MAEEAQSGTMIADVAPARRLAKRILRDTRELVQELARLEPAVEEMSSTIDGHAARLKEYGIETERKDT
jgi:hypothetical protein